jgi:hypothetical protein
MYRKTISRRDALGIIGKTGISFVSGSYFFLTLRTSSPAPALQIAEKVLISGSGSTLTVKISSRPGRHCAAAYATADRREYYKPVANSRGLVDRTGMAIIEVNVKNLPDGKIFLRVVTGNTNLFDDDIAGTEAFVIQVSRGAIAGYEGLMSRPMENARGPNFAVASWAAACYADRR